MAIRTTLFRRDCDTPASAANSVYGMEPSSGTCGKILKQQSHRRHARSWACIGKAVSGGGGAAMRRMETYCVLDVVVVLRRPGCELEKLHSGFHDILPRDVDVGGRIGR